MTAGEVGSTPSDSAGGPSMMRLTQRICSAVNGEPLAMPATAAVRKTSTKPSAVVSWNLTNLTMCAVRVPLVSFARALKVAGPPAGPRTVSPSSVNTTKGCTDPVMPSS